MRKKIALSGVDGLHDALALTAIPLGIPWPWLGKREHIPDGCVPLDGALSLRSEFEDFWGMVEAGVFECHDDADWIATPSLRGGFSFGDAATTFRWPDLNGKQADSFKGAYLRGDGRSDMQIGDMHGDAIRNITGLVGKLIQDNTNQPVSNGVFFNEETNWFNLSAGSGSNNRAAITKIDTSKALPATDPLTGENRGVGAVICWIMKVRGGTVAELSPTAPATLGSNSFNGTQHFSGGFTIGEGGKKDVLSDLSLRAVKSIGQFELSGSLVSIEGIPEDAKKIVAHVYNLKGTTNIEPTIRVGGASGINSSNYFTCRVATSGSAVATAATPTGLQLCRNDGTYGVSAVVTLIKVRPDAWLLNAIGHYHTLSGYFSAGAVRVEENVTSLHISVATGTFSGGYMTVEYEV